MISLFRPIHAVVIAFVLGVLGMSVVVLATASTGGDTADRSALVLTATFVRGSFDDSNDGPEATPAPAPPAASLPPAAAPPTAGDHRTCEEIRTAGTYVNDAERTFFLDSCQSSAAPVAGAASGRSVVLTEAERGYRVKAESIANSYLTSFQRYAPAELTTNESALIDYGGLAGGWANQMENFKPVPPRFQPAHDRLQVALWELAAHTRLVATSQVRLPDQAYEDQLLALVDTVNAAIGNYFQVLGLSLPAV